MWDETNFRNVDTIILVKGPTRDPGARYTNSRATKSYPCLIDDWGLIDNYFSMLVAVPHQTFFLATKLDCH